MRFGNRPVWIVAFCAAWALLNPNRVYAQSTYTWNGTTGGAWYSTGNWTGGTANTYPGTSTATGGGTTTDVAVFNNATTSVGIDAGAGPTLNLGAISLLGSTSLTLGNSSTTAGANLTILLNGAYAGNTGGVAGAALDPNTLLFVNGANLTIANAVGTGTQSTTVQLGINNGIFNVASGRTLTIGATISDGGNNFGFSFLGGGSLVLSGTNTFSGGVTVAAGTLSIANGSNLGTGPLSFTGVSTLSITGTAATLANNISLGSVNGQITIVTPNNSSTVINGIVSGGTATTVWFFQGGAGGQNTGALTLNGVNTLQGTINVQRGPLILGNASAAGSAIILLDSNTPPAGALQFTGNFTIPNNITLFSGVEPFGVGSGITAGIGGVISSSGTLGLNKVGAGTLVFTGANTYTGATTVSAGTLQIGSGGTAGTLGTGAITNNSVLSFNRSDVTSVANVISGTGSVVQTGSGTTTLTAANTFTGPLLINSGTLAIGLTGSIATNAVTVNSGGILDVSALPLFTFPSTLTIQVGRTGTPSADILGSPTVAGTLNVGGTGAARTATFANNLTLNASAVVIDLSNTNTVGSGVNDLVVINGNLTLTGTNNLSINQTGSSFSASAYTLFQYSGTLTGTAANFTINGSGSGTTRQSFIVNTGSGTNSAITLTVSAGAPANLTWVGNAGNNVWDLVQTVNWTGAPGATPDNRFYNLDAVTFTDTGVGGATAVNLPAAVSPGSVTVNAAQNYTFSGAGGIGGAGGLTKQGAGTLILATNNTYAAVTTITAGTLQIGNGGTSGSITSNVADNAALAFNRSDLLTYAGAISGSGTVTQAGSGELVLTGSNTYTGKTFVTAGILTVNADAALGTAPGALVVDQLSLAGGTTLKFSAGTALAANRGVTLGAGTATIDTQSNAVTIAGPTSGAGSLTKLGSGALTLNAAGTYAGGTTLSGGALVLGNIGALGTSTFTVGLGAQSTSLATVTTDPGSATVEFFNTAALSGVQSLVNNVVFPNDATPTSRSVRMKGGAGNVLQFSGVISGGSTNLLFYLNNDTSGDGDAIIRLSGANTFTAGAIRLNRGSVRLDSASALGQSTNVLIVDGNTTSRIIFTNPMTLANNVTLLSANTFDTGANAVTASGLFSGTVGFTKAGSGSLTLTNTNTYARDPRR